VRTLCLSPGIDAEELEALVDCLAHADDLVDMEQDIVTALWERDCGHIDCQVVDPFLAGEVLGEGMVDALRERVLQRLEETESLASSARTPGQNGIGLVQPARIDSARLQLTPDEIQTGEQALEGLSSVLQDFAEVLLEIAGNTRATVADDVLIRSLTGAVATFLDAGDIKGASFVLGSLERLESSRSQWAGLSGVITRGAVSRDHLHRLLREASQSPGDEEGEIERFLRSLADAAAPSLLEILAETEDRSLRRTILRLLGGEDGVPWPDLEPLLRDARWYVVRNAVQLAAAGRHERLVDHAPRLLRHSEVQVRREVVRALERVGGQAATRALAQGLSDIDSSVRTLAARAAGREGGRQVEELLQAHIEHRDFPSLPAEEVQAFFNAYARVAQERAVPLLDRSWKKRLISSRPAGVRAAAVLALGNIRGPAANASLKEASRSGDAQTVRAATQAVQMQASLASGGGA
jgi:HEAT repeat protein